MKCKNYYLFTPEEFDQVVNKLMDWIERNHHHRRLPEAWFAFFVAVSAIELNIQKEKDRQNNLFDDFLPQVIDSLCVI